MDNITHGLVGYALARAGAHEIQSDRAPQRARIWTGIVASNLPDADIVVRGWLHDPQLAYLTQHRGWTHTFVCALPLGVLTALGCIFLFGVRTLRERLACCALGAVSGLLHVGFDYLNNYGVHPFSPFDDHWYYGDSVFIIEPLLFAALLPLLAWHGLSRAGRAFGFALALAVAALVWLRREASFEVALMVSGAFALSFTLLRRARRPALAALIATLLVVGLFAGAAQRARSLALRALAVRAPAERALDAVITPAPGNPLCFSALLLSLDRSGTYRARYAHVALGFYPLAKCHPAPPGPITAPLEPEPERTSASEPEPTSGPAPDFAPPSAREREPSSAREREPESAPEREPASAREREPSSAREREPESAPELAQVHIVAAFRGDAAQLRALAAAHCDARALMHFVRAPFWIEPSENKTASGAGRAAGEGNGQLLPRPPGPILGDLRYDNSPAIEFAERVLLDRCLDAPPRWFPPRRDLLDSARPPEQRDQPLR